VGLPLSKYRGKVYDTILNVVDRYSKMVRYIPYIGATNALEMAKLLIHEIFTKYGVPRSIVSDRGTTFIVEY
jgi:hypothetical protein